MRHLIIFALAVIVLAAATPAANAACGTSTPASAAHSDSVTDGGGLAPEITTVQVDLNATCGFSMNPNLADSVLIADEGVFHYINRDGSAATGSPTFGGADIVVGIVGQMGTDGPPLIGTWNGAKFDFNDPNPVGGLGLAGFSASVDRLGLPSGVTIGVEVGTIYLGIYDNYADFAPEQGTIPLPVSYAAPAPPPPPPPPAAPPAPAAPTGGPSAPAPDVCVVPEVRGLRLAAAETKILDLDACYLGRTSRAYHATVRKGRVIKSIPSAGRQTRRAVRLVVSKGRRAKARRAGAAQLRAADRAAQASVLAAAMDRAAG
jgi:hypothetical protein